MSDVKFDIEVTGIKELKEAAANFDRLGKVSAKLSAQYKPLGAQTTRLVQEQKRLEAVKKSLTKAVEAELITEKQKQRAYEEAVRASKERILTDNKLIASAKKSAKEAERVVKTNERLTRTYAPLRAAALRLKEIQQEIATAFNQGIISAEEYDQALAAINKQFHDFKNGVATGGNQFARFNVETYKANKRLNTLRTQGLQQAGYQVGDFAVQVQSGTNVAIAFGQQMSQLLGVFGPAGALAGAAVAIGTAFVAPLLDAAKAAKDLKGDLEKLGETINNFQSYEETLRKIIEAPFFKGKEAAQAYFEYLRNESRASIGKNVVALLGTKGDESSILGGLEARRNEFSEQTVRGDRNKPKSQRRLTPDAAAGYARITSTMEEIAGAVRPAGGELYSLETMVNNLIALSEKAAKQNLPALSEAVRDLISGNADLAAYYQEEVNRRADKAIEAKKKADEEEVKRLLLRKEHQDNIVLARQKLREKEDEKRKKAAADYLKTTEVYFERERALLRKRRVAQNQISDQEIDKAVEIYNTRIDNERALSEYEKKARAEVQKYNEVGYKLFKKYNDEQKALNEKAEAQLAIENQKIASLNAQVDAVRAGDAQAKASRDAQIKAAAEIKRIQLEKLGYEGESLEKLVAAEEALRRAKFNLKDATEEARELARALQEVERAKEGLSDFGADIAKRLLVAQAQVRGLKAGKSGSTEGTIAGLMADARAKFAAIPKEQRTPEILQSQAKTIENILALKKVLEEIDRLKESGKAGKKELDALAKYLEGLKEEKKILQETLGLSEREAGIKAKLIQFEREHGTEKSELVEQYLREIDALRQSQELINSITDTVESNFGDALMSIVTDFDILNGSIEDFGYNAEQVFKNMAREIIKELYRIFVVKKITGFISAAVGDVGSLYQGSTGFMQFSGGGYTGSGPRSGGLDGKGGFLAMLHPRETVIDHTKGQSAEGVTVVQNINISTGVQQTVRNEIRTLMPQIANSAKAAVSDAKRRGGSYGRALS